MTAPDLADVLAQVAVSRAAEAHVMPADIAFAALLVVLVAVIGWGVRRGARR